MARYSKINSFNALQTLRVGTKSYQIFNLPQAAKTLGNIDRLPKSLKVLLENLLRFEDQKSVKVEHIQALVDWQKHRSSDQEIQYRPARVLMQDFTGVPAVVDLAAMRAAMAQAGGDPNRINPLSPVDLVIDHSVMVDHFADDNAFIENVEIEMQRNGERYQFLRWGQSAFNNFSRSLPCSIFLYPSIVRKYFKYFVSSLSCRDTNDVSLLDYAEGGLLLSVFDIIIYFLYLFIC